MFADSTGPTGPTGSAGPPEAMDLSPEGLEHLQALVLHDPPRAREELSRALAQSLRAADREAEARILLLLGSVAHYQGEATHLMSWCSAALRIATTDELPATRARALLGIGIAHSMLGDRHNALVWVRASLAVALKHHDEDAVIRAVENAAAIHTSLGQAEVGINLAKQAMARNRHRSHPASTAHTLTVLGAAYAAAGRPGEAMSAYYEGIAVAVQHRLFRFAVTGRLGVARLHLSLGRAAIARIVVEAALAQARAADDGESLAEATIVLGEIHLVEGAPEAALNRFIAAAVDCRRLGLRRLEVTAQHQIVTTAALCGDDELVRAHTERVEVLETYLSRHSPDDQVEFSETYRPGALDPGAPHDVQVLADSLHAANEVIEHALTHDALTDTLNRSEVLRLVGVVMAARAPGELVGLIVVDIDDMGALNEALRTADGDELIRSVGQGIHEQLRPGDVLGRTGGDEYAALLLGLDTSAELEAISRRIRDALRDRAVDSHGRRLHLTVSTGGALSEPQDDAQALVNRARAALTAARTTGGDSSVIHHTYSANSRADRRILRLELPTAIERGELYLDYQPIYSVPHRHLLGLEALIRWRHPRLGILNPAAFIPAAEMSRRILDIDAWVIDEVCRQAAEWNLMPDDPYLSANVSRLHSEEGFARHVDEALRRYHLTGATLLLEVTEGRAPDNVAAMVRGLSDVRALGVRVALDDFGSGWNSLTMVQSLPIDVVKLDRSLLAAVAGPQPEQATSILQLAVEVGNRMRLPTIVEGVETAEQYQLVTELGCSGVQGYLLGRPIPVAEAGQLITARRAN